MSQRPSVAGRILLRLKSLRFVRAGATPTRGFIVIVGGLSRFEAAIRCPSARALSLVPRRESNAPTHRF